MIQEINTKKFNWQNLIYQKIDYNIQKAIMLQNKLNTFFFKDPNSILPKIIILPFSSELLKNMEQYELNYISDNNIKKTKK
jgi:hypothetical protein